MRKSYKLDGLCCANCAAEMERKINALDEIDSASIAFMTQRLNIVCADPDAVLDKIQSIISKVDDECVILR